MPEIAIDEYSLEVVGRVRDNTVSVVPWQRQSMPKLSECWHSAYSVGRTDVTTSQKADTRHMAGLVRAGHVLMLRF